MNMDLTLDQPKIPSSMTSCRERRDDERASPINGSNFSLQRLSLDAAVSPLMSRPTAPFDRTERKRAHTSALYYSECFLRGIEPTIADSAAMNAQGQYKKWWINSTAHSTASMQRQGTKRNTTNASTCDSGSDSNKRRKAFRGFEQEEASAASASTVSVTSPQFQMQENSGADSDDGEVRPLSITEISTLGATTKFHIESAKGRLVADLKASGGNVETSAFLGCLEVLEAYYRSKNWDGRGSCSKTPFSLEGNWLTLSKPTYNECRGKTAKGEYMYTIGRMSFDMFKPTNMVCSMQAAFNHVRPIDPRNPDRPLHVPKKLMKEINKGDVNLRTYE
jgi:hypothetical protein